MAVASSFDPALVEEFQFVDRVRALFKAAGVSLAYWEGYCLSQSHRGAFGRLLERAAGTGATELPVEVLESLRVLRDRGAPIVNKLRRMFVSRPGTADEAELLEMAFAVLVGAERGREAVGRWVLAPDRYGPEANERIRSVMQRLEPLRQALRSGVPPVPEAPNPEAPAPPPAPVAAPPLPAPKPPAEVPAEILISPPGVPGGVRASPERGRVFLSWQPVADVSRYTVKRADAPSTTYVTIGTPKDCAYVDEKTVPGGQYVYIVSASNEAGEGDDSPPAAATLPAPPPAPSGLRATPGVGRVSLAWTAVPGATLYRVKRSSEPNGPLSVLASIDGSSFLDDTVKPGATHRYAVAAAGPAGDGPDSETVTAAVSSPPAAPSGLQAAPGNLRVTLKWAAVADATGYVVRRAAGSGGAYAPVARVTAPAHADSSVTNGTSYSYVVQATNAHGESAPSSPATATPVGPPVAPSGLGVSSDNKRLWLNWSPVPGAASYTVKRSATPGGPYEPVVSGVKQIRQDDVPPSRGKKYYYVVSAVGPGGEGPNSAELSKALQPPPQAPAGLAALPGHGRIALSWLPSAGATRYHVKRRVGAAAKYVTLASPEEPSHVDTTVIFGTAYEYVVSATNGDAESPDSAPVKAEPTAAPAAPSGLTAQAGDGRVALTWVAAAGAAEYRIQRTSAKESISEEIARVAGETSFVDRSVTNGTTYDYAIAALNSGGQSPFSARARATPLSAPAAPRSLEGSAGQGRVLLSWAAVPGAAAYSLKRATSSEGPYAAVSTTGETSYTDTSVANGTTYYYKVSASNAGGASADTGPFPATPIDQPATPAGLRAVPGVREIALSWQPSAGTASYTVKRATSPGGPFTTLAVVPGTSYVDKDVDYRSTYFYTITAMNAAGRSSPSDAASAAPRPSS